MVTLFNGSRTFESYDTDGDGWYTFTNIPVGIYTLIADDPENSNWIRPPSIEVTIATGTVCQEETLQYTNTNWD